MTSSKSILLANLYSRLRQLAKRIFGLTGSHVKAIDAKITGHERDVYVANDKRPKWLASLPVEDGFPLISRPARFAHDETKYDEQYLNASADLSIGQGLVNLLKEQNADFTRTALEIGCGTGVLSLGLVSSEAFPGVIVTDPSTAFLDITYNKMRRAKISTANAHLAVLKAEEIDRLPKNEFSLIALRSTLHHVLHVDKFIHDAALALKPGGSVVFQEPCTEGYILMGSIAQFIPIVLNQAGVILSKQHSNLIESFIDVMQFYARKDVDKADAEDKHLFRVDEIMKICASAGLTSDFYPNRTFEYFSLPDHQRDTGHSFYYFFYDYLKYCMSFDQPLMDLIDKHFRPFCVRIDEIARKNDPYMHGVFVCKKLP